MLYWIFYMTTGEKKIEANKYIAITKKYNTDKIIQVIKIVEIFLYLMYKKRI